MKKLVMMLCTVMMLSATTVTAMAAISPTGTQKTDVAPQKTNTAPKTGESDVLLYSMAAALLCGGVAAASKKHLAEEE